MPLDLLSDGTWNANSDATLALTLLNVNLQAYTVDRDSAPRS